MVFSYYPFLLYLALSSSFVLFQSLPLPHFSNPSVYTHVQDAFLLPFKNYSSALLLAKSIKNVVEHYQHISVFKHGFN